MWKFADDYKFDGATRRQISFELNGIGDSYLHVNFPQETCEMYLKLRVLCSKDAVNLNICIDMVDATLKYELIYENENYESYKHLRDEKERAELIKKVRELKEA